MAENQIPNPILPSEVRQRPCPLCGGNLFTWGFFNPGSSPFTFKTSDDSWLVRNTAMGGADVDARACKACGNIQLFVKQ